jgi:hypothetical protein
MNKFFKIIEKSINESIDKKLLQKDDKVLSGFSGNSLVGTLQRLSKEILDENTCYLEIGVFQGLTLLSSSMSNKSSSFYGIDNFAFFDKDNKNEKLIKQRKSKLNIENAHLINMDYEDALENLSKYIGDKKIGVYFVDGPHDYRSQLMCLLLAKPFLADNCVILVDDSNYSHVRQANRDFLISNPEFKMVFQSYTKAHPDNLSGKDKEAAVDGWWDGINILVRDKNNELDNFYPPTNRKRTLFENEHSIHASKYPDLAINMVSFFYKSGLVNFLKLFKTPSETFKGKFFTGNTNSHSLIYEKFNKFFKK